MMTLADIESWVRAGESETLELKRTTGERREAARTICAMLNHRGGRVIFGVAPEGRLIGQMGELTVRAGLASPEILEAGGCVTVRFSPARYVPPQRVAQDVTARQQRVLAVLSTSADGLALRDIRKVLGGEIAEWEVKNELAALKHLGVVQVRGHARWARWVLS